MAEACLSPWSVRGREGGGGVQQWHGVAAAGYSGVTTRGAGIRVWVWLRVSWLARGRPVHVLEWGVAAVSFVVCGRLWLGVGVRGASLAGVVAEEQKKGAWWGWVAVVCVCVCVSGRWLFSALGVAVCVLS